MFYFTKPELLDTDPVPLLINDIYHKNKTSFFWVNLDALSFFFRFSCSCEDRLQCSFGNRPTPSPQAEGFTQLCFLGLKSNTGKVDGSLKCAADSRGDWTLCTRRFRDCGWRCSHSSQLQLWFSLQILSLLPRSVVEREQCEKHEVLYHILWDDKRSPYNLWTNVIVFEDIIDWTVGYCLTVLYYHLCCVQYVFVEDLYCFSLLFSTLNRFKVEHL